LGFGNRKGLCSYSVLVISVCAILSGIGGCGYAARPGSQSAQSPSDGSSGGISAIPSSVAFGPVAVGTTDSQQITLKNNGNAALTLTQMSVAGSGFAQSGLAAPLVIGAGATSTFNAIFDPASTGASNGTITLLTNGNPSSLIISMSGTGQVATASLQASPTSLSFGNVSDGQSSSQTTQITNNGNSNVTISGVSVAGAGFSVQGIAQGTTLTPGQSITATVVFAPAQGGAMNGASITIASNAANSSLAIGLSGTGSHSVSLAWMASSAGDVMYNVFRGVTSGGEATTPINSAPIAATTYTDTNVVAGQEYFYTVEAFNSAGSSAPSNETIASIPNP
jgi:hypothetical protein